MENITNQINFDHTPGQTEQSEQTFVPKDWTIISKFKFDRQCVKIGHYGKHLTRLVLPKELIDIYSITTEFKAYFILYRAENKLILILSKSELEDADYVRALSPVGVGLYCTPIPPKLTRHLGLERFPDYVWLVNTNKSDEETIILEVYPE